jgi:hypothetical protein
MALLERAAPGHVSLVRELLFDALTPDQVRALADGLGEAVRRMADGPGKASRPTAGETACPGPGPEAAADLSA